jgi:hypothetical protein
MPISGIRIIGKSMVPIIIPIIIEVVTFGFITSFIDYSTHKLLTLKDLYNDLYHTSTLLFTTKYGLSSLYNNYINNFSPEHRGGLDSAT